MLITLKWTGNSVNSHQLYLSGPAFPGRWMLHIRHHTFTYYVQGSSRGRWKKLRSFVNIRGADQTCIVRLKWRRSVWIYFWGHVPKVWYRMKCLYHADLEKIFFSSQAFDPIFVCKYMKRCFPFVIFYCMFGKPLRHSSVPMAMTEHNH